MMKLFTAGPSPFGRKIKMALDVVGLTDNVELVAVDTAAPDSENRRLNPLGKIPTLIVDDNAIFDSRVIVDYLHHNAANSPLIPADNAARTKILTRSALMDGILDAAILVVYESRMRPEDKYVDSFVEYQRGKIIRSLAMLEAETPVYSKGAAPDIADITLACAIDYLDFRKQVNWRDHAPSLERWITEFAASVPSYHPSLPEGIEPAPWRTA